MKLSTRLAALALVMALALTALVGSLPAEAGDMWSVWLYNFATNDLLRVYEDGATEPGVLVIPDGHTLIGPPSISSGGSWAAYCTQDAQPSGALWLHVIDLYAGDPDAGQPAYGLTLPISQELPGALSCVLPIAFNDANDARLALSLAHQMPGSAASDMAWELAVFDLQSGERYALSSDHAGLQALLAETTGEDLLWVPRVINFRGNGVTFALDPMGIGGPYVPATFTWLLDLDEVIADPIGGQPGFSTMQATDEVGQQIGATAMMWLANDPLLPPLVSEMRPIPALNTLMFAMGEQGPYPILHHPGDLWGPIFFGSGQQVAVLAMTEANPEGEWLMLGDPGGPGVLDVPPNAQLISAPGAYAYLAVDFDSGFTVFSHWPGPGASEQVLWQSDQMGWEIVWQQPFSAATAIEPLPAAE